MKVKLLRENVVNGGVYGKDAVVDVSDAEGKRLIARGEAVAAETSAAPKPVTGTAVKKEQDK